DRAAPGQAASLSERARLLLRRCWRFALCGRPLPAAYGYSAAFPVRHPPAGCWRLRSFGSSWRTVQNWFHGNEKRKLATRAGFAFHPDLAVHSLQKTAGNGESKAHALGRFAAGQTEEVVKNFQVKLWPDSGAGIGHADFDSVRHGARLTAAFSWNRCGVDTATFPHMRL